MSLSTFFNCCRPKNWLGEPEFTADLPLDEEVAPPSCFETLGGRIVSTIYTAGALLVAKKDFEGAREKIKQLDGHELKTIRTWDGVSLDTVYMPGTVKKAVILAPGIGDRFESLAIDGSLLQHIQKVIREQLGDVTMVSPNVRGFGWSEGSFAPKRLHIDIHSVHQYLVNNEGFAPEDIFIFGESFGGCSGIRAAALVQKSYPDKNISAIPDRSFLRLKDVVEQRTGGRCTNLVSGILSCTEFDVDCEEAAKSLKGKILALGAQEDQTVPFQSFFGAYEEIKELKNLETLYITGDADFPDPHTRYWLPEEQNAIGDALRTLVFGKEPEEIKQEEVVVSLEKDETIATESPSRELFDDLSPEIKEEKPKQKTAVRRQEQPRREQPPRKAKR
ncbi:MAG: hypothetical protein JSR46_05230 [Verrucomicrobia bacterium]|nr:hypothetical protein [Verrucomicrobiota bacterium]